MTRGHAGAVILLGGWLLMTPPLKERPAEPTSETSTTLTLGHGVTILGQGGKLEPDTSAPITQWMQIAAFDTAKECETERAKHLSKGEAVQQQPPPGYLPFGHQKDMKWFLARCVPAESVYPPQPPSQK